MPSGFCAAFLQVRIWDLISFDKPVTTAVLLTLAAIGLGIGNVADRLQWKQASDGYVWRETPYGLKAVYRMERPAALPPSGLTEGDVLLSINGITILNRDDYTEVVELLAETLPEGTPATYSVRRAARAQPNVRIFRSWSTAVSLRLPR